MDVKHIIHVLITVSRLQMSLVGYSPRGHEEPDTTERLSTVYIHLEKAHLEESESVSRSVVSDSLRPHGL